MRSPSKAATQDGTETDPETKSSAKKDSKIDEYDLSNLVSVNTIKRIFLKHDEKMCFAAKKPALTKGKIKSVKKVWTIVTLQHQYT